MKSFFLAFVLLFSFCQLSQAAQLCPDGSWHASCHLCPDGTWQESCSLSPDGHYGGNSLCPDGTWHGSCGLCPNGHYGCQPAPSTGIVEILRQNGVYVYQVKAENKQYNYFIAQALASNRQCASNMDCPGFANSCFAGRCTQPGDFCDSNADCPGFANSCFAGKCVQQGALCNTNDDCPGFANSCFAGKCTNP